MELRRTSIFLSKDLLSFCSMLAYGPELGTDGRANYIIINISDWSNLLTQKKKKSDWSNINE